MPNETHRAPLRYNISDFFSSLLVDYQAKGNQIELIGKELLDDKPVYRLRLTNKNGEVRFYLFDASTFFLQKWEGMHKNRGIEIPWETYFSEFHEVGGLKYAYRIDQGSPGTGDKQTLITEKIEIDPPIEVSRFAKPALPDAPTAPGASANPPPSN